jgi:hypothetical protein
MMHCVAEAATAHIDRVNVFGRCRDIAGRYRGKLPLSERVNMGLNRITLNNKSKQRK